MGTGTVIDQARLRQIRLWCRRHAARKSALAKEIWRRHGHGTTHEGIRIDLGVTVEGYKRAKAWLAEARAESSPYVSVEEALDRHAERHAERVMRFAHMRLQGASRQQIRERLGLSDEVFESVDEWYRDALAATERYDGENGI